MDFDEFMETCRYLAEHKGKEYHSDAQWAPFVYEYKNGQLEIRYELYFPDEDHLSVWYAENEITCGDDLPDELEAVVIRELAKCYLLNM